MATIIRLLDATGGEVQDSISGEYEDSFSLDTFNDLCKAHFAAEPTNTKGFVIARVQTVDPKQPDKEFYSYYNAFHLNKTLFQTQIYLKKRYIHRLHVLNPLTNSDIIGNVLYYLVKPPQTADTVIVEIGNAADEPSGDKAASIRRLSVIYTQPEKPKEEIPIDVDKFNGQKLFITTHKIQYENPETMRTPPALLKKLTTKKKSTLNADADQPRLSELSRRNTMNSYPATDIAGQKQINMEPGFNVTSRLPTGSIPIGESPKTNVPLGAVTRFAVPVPESELAVVIPKTQKGTRRSLSYRNAVSASGVPASFFEWAQMVHEEHDQKNGPDLKDSDEYDKVKFATSATSTVTFTGRDQRAKPTLKVFVPKHFNSPSGILSSKSGVLEAIIDDEDEVRRESKVKEEKKSEDSLAKSGAIEAEPIIREEPPPLTTITFYDAVLFANDNDFLEASKIRQIFRNNAIQSDDAKLFEMKEFTGDDSTPQDFEIVRDTFPCGDCFCKSVIFADHRSIRSRACSNESCT